MTLRDVAGLDAGEIRRLDALKRYGILDTAPETEFENIISLVQSTFNVPIAAISFIDTDRQWFKASRGLSMTETPRDIAFCDYTIRSDNPFTVEDATLDDRFSANPFVTSENGVRCYMGVPLKSIEGQNIGSLCVLGTEARKFTSEEALILERFAALIVTQLELRLTLMIDEMTNALTRAAFFEQVAAALKAFKKDTIPFVLAIIDVDSFKEINDTYGHPVGDKILTAFAQACMNNIRKDDLLGRIGGDEFAVLLRAASDSCAERILPRIRESISEIRLEQNKIIEVTSSIGWAALTDSVETKDEWIEQADLALYQAKSRGRNCTVRFTP